MTIEILIKFQRFETLWVRKNGSQNDVCLSIVVVVCGHENFWKNDRIGHG